MVVIRNLGRNLGRILGSAAGAILAMALFAAPTQALAGWKKAESEHFVIYSDRTDAAMTEYAAMLEDFDGLMRLMHPQAAGKTSPRKLDVYLVGDRRDIRRVVPSAPDGVVGFYHSSAEDIFAIAVKDVAGLHDTTRGDDVVLHEYVHHFMMQYYEFAYPPWLIEGYAEYYATVDLGQKRITIGNVSAGRRRSLQQRGGDLGVDAVLTKRLSEVPKIERGSYYAQSWLLTHYIMSDPGRRAKLKIYLAEWRKDGDSLKAWKTAFGQDPQALERSLRQYQDRPLTAMVLSRDAAPPPAVTITPLSAAADDILLETLQLKMNVPTAGRPAMLNRVRALYQKLPADRIARIAAARAEVRYGDRGAGEAILRKMIADDPADWEAMLVLAQSRIVAARATPAQRTEYMAEASRLLTTASKIRPNDYRVYVLFGQTRNGMRGEPSENTLNILGKAVELAPQVESIRLTAASALLRRGASDEVRVLLEPIANNPHEGPVMARAQAILASVAKNDAAAAVAAAEAQQAPDADEGEGPAPGASASPSP